MLSLLLLYISLTTPPPAPTPWVPADTGDQSCGIDAHRHSEDVDTHGHWVVNRQKGEPDIVFDGLCHDDNTEKIVKDPSRQVLPVPKGEA